jgi:DNA repair protein RecO (recombination protein O)
MLVKTRGIIFRSVKYRETSLILDIYTREMGLKTYLVNGVRKKNARTGAALYQVMNILDMNVYDHDQRDINRIKEARPAIIYKELPFRIEKSSVGLLMLEVIRKSIREKEKNTTLFDFIESAFDYLDQAKGSIANFHISFLLELSTALGFNPENNYNDVLRYFDLREGTFVSQAPFHRDYLTEKDSNILSRFLNSNMEAHQNIKLNKNERIDLLVHLIDFYRIQIGDFGEMKSLDVFRDIFK